MTEEQTEEQISEQEKTYLESVVLIGNVDEYGLRNPDEGEYSVGVCLENSVFSSQKKREIIQTALTMTLETCPDSATDDKGTGLVERSILTVAINLQ